MLLLYQHNDSALLTKSHQKCPNMKNSTPQFCCQGQRHALPTCSKENSINPTALPSKFQGIPWVPLICGGSLNTIPCLQKWFPFLTYFCYGITILSLRLKILVSLFFFWTPSPINSSNSIHFLTSPLLQSTIASSSSYHIVYQKNRTKLYFPSFLIVQSTATLTYPKILGSLLKTKGE